MDKSSGFWLHLCQVTTSVLCGTRADPSACIVSSFAADVNACLSFPCTNGTGGTASCADLANPAPNSAAGRTCNCSTGSFYKDDTSGCVDINACTYWPCNSAGAGGAANCKDLTGAANSTAGRTCNCSTGSFYKDDISGCVDINACTYWLCNSAGAGGAANCKDLTGAANNTAGRACTCTNGGLYSDASGCAVVGEAADDNLGTQDISGFVSLILIGGLSLPSNSLLS